MFDILERFCLDGKTVSCKPYGSGHINRTHLVTTERGHAYILQKINDDVFQDVSALMHNISSVTRHLRAAGPVSYTHLDVYKRQVLSFKIWPVDFVAFSGSVFCRPWACRLATCSLLRPDSGAGKAGNVMAQHLLYPLLPPMIQPAPKNRLNRF